MLRTPVCDVFGIEVPVVQGPLGGPWQQQMELPAAVSNAGGLGSVPTALRTAGQVRHDIARLRDLTDQPFAVNMTRRPFLDDVFEAILADPPPIFSLALGEPGGLVKRVHDAGSVFMQQVTTVEQAERAAEAGADVISAQGTEAGGFSGRISTMALVPQIVDAVSPLPVLASGGIADGRGLAAALALGAQGVSIGTRFLASEESGISPEWQASILAAASEDAVKVTFAAYAFQPATAGGYDTEPRALRTSFIDEWNSRPNEAEAAADLLRAQMRMAAASGVTHHLVPLAGQSAGLIHEVLPAAEIVRGMVADAEAALRRALS
jgi:nitronate monooxygenase/enoyl-[acyl-carrier protein] reductase II